MVEEQEPDFDIVVKQERTRMGSETKRQKDTARLVWASKPRKEPSAKDLVFQTAEIVYPNKAAGVLTSFFEKEGQDVSKNPNRLIWGDNLLVMQALLAHGYENQIDLIYIDPPFNTGENFNFPNTVQIGDEEFEKEMPVSERLAYTDTWNRGLDSFLDMLYPRIQLMERLLSNTGSFYLHIDQTVGHYAKVVLDEIFGPENFKREIIWATSDTSGFKSQAKNWTRSHDMILFYVKSKEYAFEKQYLPHKEEYLERFKKTDAKGRRYRDDRGGRVQYLDESKGKLIGDVWFDIESFQQASTNTEYIGYPTQKREAILERIINASSEKNSLVADFFCGSGTTAAVAERLERRWITTDLSKTSIQVARARLVNQNAKPYLIENLGNYQRQLIYLHEVKLKETYDIILNLYGAKPREDKQGVGISFNDRSTLVYVCEPDRPMTAKKAVELAKDAVRLDGKGYRNLVILAWDYEYNYDEDLKRYLRTNDNVASIESKLIPPDVYKYLRSTNVGDPALAEKITFYQKPYVKISEPKIISKDGEDRIIKLSIDQYIVMDNPIKDEEKRKEAEALLRKNYAYLIDFWAVDWDYDEDTFRSRWQAIRNKRAKEPVITSSDFRLKSGKRYKIAIRVVDVFGNDASAVKEIDLR